MSIPKIHGFHIIADCTIHFCFMQKRLFSDVVRAQAATRVCVPAHRSVAMSRSCAVTSTCRPKQPAAQAPAQLPRGRAMGTSRLLATRHPHTSTNGLPFIRLTGAAPRIAAPRVDTGTNRFGLLSEELTELPSEAVYAGLPISVSAATATAASLPASAPAAREDSSVSSERVSFWYAACVPSSHSRAVASRTGASRAVALSAVASLSRLVLSRHVLSLHVGSCCTPSAAVLSPPVLSPCTCSIASVFWSPDTRRISWLQGMRSYSTTHSCHNSY